MNNAVPGEPTEAHAWRPAVFRRPAIFRQSGLLGTVVEVRLVGYGDDEAAAGHAAVVGEIERLEHIFSAFEPTSEFCRWRRGSHADWSPEFTEVMELALEWQHRSEGRFNPMAGELSDCWRAAESDGTPPTARALAEIVDRIRPLRFEMADGVPVPLGDCSAMNLNAVAKGYIVDRALDRVVERLGVDGDRWVSVNAGGDLAHRGNGALRVGIENPHRPYDNEPPLTTIAVSNAAVATSGLARRGFRFGDRWYGHVIDPTTGWPVDDTASISVVGPNAATADVVATAAGVLAPAHAVSFIDDLETVEAMAIGRGRDRHQTRGWARFEVDRAD